MSWNGKKSEIALPRDRGCGALARRFAEERLRDGLDPEAMDDVRLVVSELVDNAYLHGRGEIRLIVERRPDRVRIEVVDEGRGAAVRIRERGPEQLGGHGLKLVDALAADWGAFEGTTHVWAELEIAARRRC
jgi:anti-sigma regulatory factor (Ser/Thr protein kinase)